MDIPDPLTGGDQQTAHPCAVTLSRTEDEAVHLVQRANEWVYCIDEADGEANWHLNHSARTHPVHGVNRSLADDDELPVWIGVVDH